MAETPRAPRRRPPWGPLLALAALAGLAGFVLPWVAHPAPALQVAGLDLGEYVKFLPEVRGGQVRLLRELFYLPVPASCLALLLAGWRAQGRSRWFARAAAVALSLPMALLVLPPVWHPATLFQGEFRWQGVALVTCWAAAVGSPALLLRPVRQVFALAVAALAAAAALVPPYQFGQVYNAIETVYNQPVQVGAGAWLSSAAYLAAAALALALFWEDRRRSPVSYPPTTET